MAEVVSEIAPTVTGRTLIVASNGMGIDPNGGIVSTVPAGTTQGTHLADLLPRAHVVRAFTHVMAELLESRGRTQPALWAMAVAGDDREAVAIASRLVEETGFTPVFIGNLASSGRWTQAARSSRICSLLLT